MYNTVTRSMNAHNTYHDPENAIFIINPVSGTGDQKRRKTDIVRFAKELGWKGKIIETTRKRNGGTIAAEQIKNGANHIVVCGGDGTIMEVLQEVVSTNVTLGIVPLGTGNLFAQNLNITGSLRTNVQTSLFGKLQRIDIGQANGTYFAVIAGIGFDAEVMRQAKRRLKSKFGLLAYVVAVFKSYNRTSGKYKITIDGKESFTFRAKTILFANMGKIQGGIELVPNAHYQSGFLSVGILQTSSLPSWMNALGNALIGNVNKSPHYTLMQGKHFEVVSLRGPKPYQCDGNYFPSTKKLSVDIYPKSLAILTQ
jgi:YegS/Rv2252/BmrU family lipid kinase